MKGLRLQKRLRYLVYLLPLLMIHLTAHASYSANTAYDGAALYNAYCAACHNTGTGGAQPISGVTGRGDDVNITKNAITTNKSRAGVTTNMSAYSFLTNTQLQTIANYTFPASETMPLPTAQTSVPPSSLYETPVLSANPLAASPIGVGNINGGFVNWQIGLPAFPGPVDLVAIVQINNTLYFLSPNNTFVSNLSVWKTVQSGVKTDVSITESLGISSGNLPLSALPTANYSFYIGVLPAGNLNAGNYSAYYLYQTLKF